MFFLVRFVVMVGYLWSLVVFELGTWIHFGSHGKRLTVCSFRFTIGGIQSDPASDSIDGQVVWDLPTSSLRGLGVILLVSGTNSGHFT